MGHVCPWWFAYTFDNPLRPFYHKPEIIFSPYVTEGMCVADIGCGLGYFSLGLAKIVGERGKVIAVDIQHQMLHRMQKRADKAELTSIIYPNLCSESNIEINEPLDFALAFWMVHESPDPSSLFKQLYSILKPSGTLLITEPLFHVSKEQFLREIELAQDIGFQVKEEPQIIWSHAAALSRGEKK